MIDLHVHTTNSDGDFTTEEILKEAEENNIEILSIADHNNITSYDEIKKLSKIYDGKLVVGTELEFTKDGRLFDMLGYGFDPERLKETEIIKKGMIHSTIEGETKILNKLKETCDRLGIIYDPNLTINNAYNMANDVLVDNILSIAQNKEILDNMGIYDRSSFYRQHFCNPISPFYIDQTMDKYDIFYVCRVIHEAGGKTFLAHPFVYKLDNLKEFLDEIVSYGILDGIECEHRKHTEEQIKWLEDYCNKKGLLKCGGSDKHTSKHYIGHSNENKREISKSLVEDWIYDIIK